MPNSHLELVMLRRLCSLLQRVADAAGVFALAADRVHSWSGFDIAADSTECTDKRSIFTVLQAVMPTAQHDVSTVSQPLP